MADTVLNSLKKHFNYDVFLEGQEHVISRILDGEDLCVIMPTGAGKSLCFQLPALLRERYTLVISPLISLMKDQVDSLREKGISAEYINSTLRPREQQAVINNTAAGRTKLLYIAPERLRSPDFLRLIQDLPPDLLVIDEAHCISQWGHDFRPDYTKIGAFAKQYEIKQVCAFTATATPVVREDIATQLDRELQLFITGFTRPNLAFTVVNCHNNAEKIKRIQSKLTPRRPTIIYCSTRKNVETVAEQFGCIRYHAGMSDEERNDAQDHFISDECPIIAATNAFGMGIDRPDIRQVIHFNIPGSLEAYYQEAGRAGRDGEEAECLLLYGYQDKFTHEFLIEMNNPPPFIVLATYQTLLQLASDQNSDHLEIPVTGITAMVTGAKGDQQVSAALKILEKNDYLQRGYRSQNTGMIRVLKPIDTLLTETSDQKTQRSIFTTRMINFHGERLTEGLPCSYQDLSAITKLSEDQVRRVLRALNGDLFEWIPPFSGRSISLTKPEVRIAEIDFTETEKKINLEKKRLDDMLSYPQTRSCRQDFIIGYFGQKIPGWRCHACDRCLSGSHGEKREPTPDEIELISTILQGVVELGGRFGKNKVSLFLTGSRSQDILKSGLHHYSSYGCLTTKSHQYVLGLMIALIDSQCIETTGDTKYPRVVVTALGRSVLKGERNVAIEFPENADPPPKTRTSSKSKRSSRKPSESFNREPGEDMPVPESGSDDLYERLRTVRNQLAATKRLIPYQIVNNRTLRELAIRAPLTVEEARSISGIGRKTEKTALPKLLAEIADWRKDNSLTAPVE